MSSEPLCLYPSNWLYNAGVIGFLGLLESSEKDFSLEKDGKVKIERKILKELGEEEENSPPLNRWQSVYIRQNHEYFLGENVDNNFEVIKKLFSKGCIYQNLYNPKFFNEGKERFAEIFFKKELDKISGGQNSNDSDQNSSQKCGVCFEKSYEVEPIKLSLMRFLFPTYKEFPNAYWQNEERGVMQICVLCKFIITHHHLAFTRLSDGSEIFINAPSFESMWCLNKMVHEVFSGFSPARIRTKREVLGLSLIEYAMKIETTLGVWTGMNVEVVSRRKEKIEFFSLPYEVVQLLMQREIASLLKRIGELSVLNLFLNKEFSRMMELGYNLLRIGAKSEIGNFEKGFLKDNLKLEKNQKKPQRVANQIFQLLAYVKENELNKGV
ncbi:MAG: hypothetical protein RML33_08700 [Acidobacteriota bacterium]|nr:hypothetical protein [Acidobacteriota bacterium]